MASTRTSATIHCACRCSSGSPTPTTLQDFPNSGASRLSVLSLDRRRSHRPALDRDGRSGRRNRPESEARRRSTSLHARPTAISTKIRAPSRASSSRPRRCAQISTTSLRQGAGPMSTTARQSCWRTRATKNRAGPGTAKIVSYRNAAIDIEADAPDGGVAFLGDVYHPWWECLVDGKPAANPAGGRAFPRRSARPSRHRCLLPADPVNRHPASSRSKLLLPGPHVPKSLLTAGLRPGLRRCGQQRHETGGRRHRCRRAPHRRPIAAGDRPWRGVATCCRPQAPVRSQTSRQEPRRGCQPRHIRAVGLRARARPRQSRSRAVRAIANTTAEQIAGAVLRRPSPILALTGYDALALRQIRATVPYRTTAFGSFTSYAISFTLGFPLITGGTVRYWIYSRAGLSAARSRTSPSFAGVTFWLAWPSSSASASCARRRDFPSRPAQMAGGALIGARRAGSPSPPMSAGSPCRNAGAPSGFPALNFPARWSRSARCRSASPTSARRPAFFTCCCRAHADRLPDLCRHLCFRRDSRHRQPCARRHRRVRTTMLKFVPA